MSILLDRQIRYRAALCHLSILSGQLPVILQLIPIPQFAVRGLDWSIVNILLALLFGLCLSLLLEIPLLICNRSTHPFITEAQIETINFTLSTILYLSSVTALSIALVGLTQLLKNNYINDMLATIFFNGAYIYAILFCFAVLRVVAASIKVSAGKRYYYPATIRFLK